MPDAWTALWSHEGTLVVSDHQYQGDNHSIAHTDHRECVKTQHELLVRIKELTCLQRVRDLVHEYPSVESLCRNTVEAIVKGMQFPEITAPQIRIGEQVFSHESVTPELSHGLVADIEAGGVVYGTLSVFYTEDRPFIIPHEQGLVDSVAKILSHYCDRKRIDDALRESEQRFMDMLYSSTDAILLIEGDAFVDANLAAVRMLGYRSREELLGEHPSQISPPNQPDGACSRVKAEAMINEALTSGFNRFEWVHLNADGEPIDVEVSLTPIAFQGRTILHCLWRDISHEKKIEEELRKTIRQQDAIFESSLVGIMVLENRIITRVNQRMAEMLGYTREEIENKGPQQLHLSVENFHHFGAMYYWQLAGREIVNVVYPLRHKDGHTVWCQFNGKALAPPDLGKGAVWIIEDITEKRAAEEALRESSERFEILAAQSRIITWEVDEQGLLTHIGPVCERVLGYRPDELIGKKHFYDLHPEDGRDDFKREAFAVFKNRRAFRDVPNRMETRDGRIVWVSTDGIPIFDTTGQLVGYRGVDRDITEQKTANEALKKSREQYMLAVNGSNDGVWDWDLQTNDLFLSPKWKEMLGYTDAELPNRFSTYTDLLHPDDAPRVQGYLEEYLQGTMEHYDIEFRLRHKDGHYVDIQARGEAIRDENGIPYRMAGSHTDISDRKEIERSLAQQREALEHERSNLQAIFDTAQVGLFLINEDFLITRVNQVAAQLVRREVSEMLHQQPGDALACVTALHEGQGCGNGTECSECPIRRGLAGIFETNEEVRGLEVERQIEVKGRVRDFFFLINAAPIILRGGRNILMSILDITERKRSELEIYYSREKLEYANKQLARSIARSKQLAARAELANQAKSRFLANMSHEIRTPMNGIIGMTSLLRDTELTDEQRQYVEIVNTCGDQLLNLINDILDFSKIEAGKLELEDLDFDLVKSAEEVADILALKAQEKGLEFHCYVSPRIPKQLRGDPGRLRQILINLANNAIKFTDAGEVTIRAELVYDDAEHDRQPGEGTDQPDDGVLMPGNPCGSCDRVEEGGSCSSLCQRTRSSGVTEVGSNHDDPMVTIRFIVQDSGIGISPERIKNLFQSFSQGDASTTRRFGGTGLGLAISKQLAEMMGGQIGVESVEGQGSTFWFTVVLEKQEQPVCLASTIISDVKGARVLVVDDNETSRIILQKYLQAWGCHCELADSAEAAMAMMTGAAEDNRPFQLAILDRVMPGQDGEELAREIKATDSLKQTPLVMLTSAAQTGDSDRLTDAGFEQCLLKPVRQSQLLDCLQGILCHSLGETFVGPPDPATDPDDASDLSWIPTNFRILLAEDNIVNQKLALTILEKKLGLHANAVANGAEAVEALKQIPYDIVLMDCHMPEMDGYEATRTIRDPDSGVLNPNVRIVAMTANAMKGDREVCIEAGMDDYIPKPIRIEQLLRVIRRNIDPNYTQAPFLKVVQKATRSQAEQPPLEHATATKDHPES